MLERVVFGIISHFIDNYIYLIIISNSGGKNEEKNNCR